MSTWLITGCSTGLGRHLAEAVLEAGHTAVVTARDVSTVEDLVGDNPQTALALPLDVTDDAQIVDAVGQAEERFGRVDVLVNNAGYGYRAAVEEGEVEAVAGLLSATGRSCESCPGGDRCCRVVRAALHAGARE